MSIQTHATLLSVKMQSLMPGLMMSVLPLVACQSQRCVLKRESNLHCKKSFSALVIHQNSLVFQKNIQASVKQDRFTFL